MIKKTIYKKEHKIANKLAISLSKVTKEKQNLFKICLMKFETVSLFEKQFKKLAKS